MENSNIKLKNVSLWTKLSINAYGAWKINTDTLVHYKSSALLIHEHRF